MRNRPKRISGICITLGKVCAAIVVSVSFIFPVSLFPRSPVYPSRIAGAEVVSTSTREGRLEVFDDAWSTIDQRYYDRTFHGLDWDAQRTTFRSLAAEATSSQELYAVLRRMIASLNDPHTRVFAPEEKFDWWRPRFVSIGLSVREIDGLPTVVQVEKGSAPQRAGVRRGDVIEDVNGTPALSLINHRLANLFVSASSSSRFRAFATMMEGPAESWVEIRWKGKNDKVKSARFERHWQQRELGLRVRRIKSEYAVLEIDAFTKSIAVDFALGLKEKIEGARGLILDLRNNGGGDAEAMADIASAFLGSGLDLGQFVDRSGGSFTISTRSKSLFTSERISQTRLPMVVLTSERTSSAAEILVAALKASKRATIIGTETCGCVLAIRTRHTLPDGGVLDVSELDYQTPAGDRLEGHGIKPDETVVVERKDLYSGRDQAMESSIRKLTSVQINQH
jgi:carboxyl-terminal processing protease